MSENFLSAMEATVNGTKKSISNALTLSLDTEKLLSKREARNSLKAELKKALEELNALDDVCAIYEVGGFKFFGKEK